MEGLLGANILKNAVLLSSRPLSLSCRGAALDLKASLAAALPRASRTWEQRQAMAFLPSKVHWSLFPRTSSLLRTCKCLQAPELGAEKQASAPDSAADFLGDARRVVHRLTQPPAEGFLVLQKCN